MSYLWGIDLGGTKIEAVVIHAETHEVIIRTRINTEADQGYEHIIERISFLIQKVEAESGLKRPAKIGLGTPGVSDPATGLMRNANTVCLIGKPLISEVEEKLLSKIIAANDANCFALAEATLGAGKGHEVVFGVILGTGVGGGIVVNGKVLNGLLGIAGEWGHNILDPNGDECYCGKRGCVETVLSGPFMKKHFKTKYGKDYSLSQIEIYADSGDNDCQRFLAETYDQFGKAMSMVVNILDPTVIILGGGVSNLNGFYTLGTAALHLNTFHNWATTPVIKAKLGDSAGVIGAALLTL